QVSPPPSPPYPLPVGAPDTRAACVDLPQPLPQSAPVFFRSMRQTLFRLSLTSPPRRNLRRAATTHSPAYKIRGKSPANLRACTRPLVLRSATLRRRGAPRTKLYAIARSPQIPADRKSTRLNSS